MSEKLIKAKEGKKDDEDEGEDAVLDVSVDGENIGHLNVKPGRKYDLNLKSEDLEEKNMPKAGDGDVLVNLNIGGEDKTESESSGTPVDGDSSTKVVQKRDGKDDAEIANIAKVISTNLA